MSPDRPSGDDVVLAMAEDLARQLRELVVAGAVTTLHERHSNGLSWRLPAEIADLIRKLPGPRVPRAAPEGSALRTWGDELDTTTAAIVLGVSREAVRRLAGRGALPARRLDDRCRSWRLDADAVRRRAAERGRPVSAFEADLKAAQATADAAQTAAHALRVRSALVDAGMPQERATADLAAALVAVPAGADDQTLQAAVQRARDASPGLFGSPAAPGPSGAAQASAGAGSSGLRALREYGYIKDTPKS